MSTQKTTDSTFEADVQNSDVPVLVDFWATWCGPCRMVDPIIDKIAEEVGGKAKVFKMNVEENLSTAERYGITGIPTIIIFKNGKVDTQFLGVQIKEVYIGALGI